MPYSPPAPRWDIVEEHLHEAEFLWGMWEHGLRAPDFTPADVARGPEARLAAHLDALVVNGPEVGPRLLVPALAADEPQLVSAAAAALLRTPGPAGLDAVVTALHGRPGPAIVRALEWAERPDLTACLRALADEPGWAAAAALHGRGERLGEAVVSRLLASTDPVARALGLAALADEAEPAPHLKGLQAALGDSDPAIVDAAVLAGVRLGVDAAWARARGRAGERGGGASLLLLALAEVDVPAVFAALAHRRRRAAALWALGSLGTPAAVDASLEWLDDEAVGALAGEVFTAVTGVDLVNAGMALPRRDRNPLAHVPEDSLPRPEPMAVLRWWTQHRGEFVDGARYVAGSPRTRASLVAAIAGGPMRRCGARVLDVQLHTAVAPRLRPYAPVARQRRALAAIHGSVDRPLVRG